MEEVEIQTKCIAINSPVAYALSTSTRFILMNVELFKEKDRKKQTMAYYNAIQFLTKEVLDQKVATSQTSGDLLLNGVSLSQILVEKGFVKCRDDIKLSNLVEAEKKAKEQKVGFWGKSGDEPVPSLNEKNLKQYLQAIRAKNNMCSIYTEKIEGLKLHVYCLDHRFKAVIYFCELRIPHITGLDVRAAWGQVETFLCNILFNKVVLFKFQKEDVYKGEVSLYGNLLNGSSNVREELLSQGLAELSSNSRDFITKQQWETATQAAEYAKKNQKGLYGFDKNKNRDYQDEPQQERIPIKAIGKFKLYQKWIKDLKRINSIGAKNPNEQISQIISQLVWEKNEELTDVKIKKLRVLAQVFTVLMLNRTAKYIPQMKEYMLATCALINNLTERLPMRLQSAQYVKLINILLRGLVFCMHEIKENKEDYIKVVQPTLRQVFRLAYLGNPVLHAKIFGRLKDLQLDNFEFSVLDLSGVSSMSEVSDGQGLTTGRQRQESRKRLQQSYTKVRISASLLLSLMLKAMPVFFEKHWELIARSSTFSEEFNEHIRELKLKFQGQPMSFEERQRVLSLMRINFGEHSLLSLLVFEESSRVKANLLECVGSLLTDFQGRKILPTLDLALLEKETRSFVPKSLVVFYLYRNVFYTLLFCLYHQKNLEVAQTTVRALTLQIEHTALLQKMAYQQGLNVLIGNFLVPILQFPSQSTQISSLQQAAVACLTAIISCDRVWVELDQQWFSPDSKPNVNTLLLNIIKERDRNDDPLVEQINIYMTKLTNHYLLAFIRGEPSIWTQLSNLQKTKPNSSFGRVIQQLCRKTSPNDQDEEQHQQARLSAEQSVFYEGFLGEYLPKWIQNHENCETPQQIIEVIEILACLSNTVLARSNYQRVRAFSVYCFQQLSTQHEQIKYQQLAEIDPPFKPFGRVEEFRSNVLVRVTYVKLIGHMSFCEVYRTPSIIQNSFKNILSILRGAKGANTLIRCSWALSNWCSVQGFSEILSKEQIQETWKWLCEFARSSDKEKIASNGTRGIGMMIRHLPKQAALSHISDVEQVMVSNINHKSPKVSWNCSVALRTILKSQNSQVCLELFNREQFMASLLHNFSRSNFKLQLQTLQTLRCLNENQMRIHAGPILDSIADILQQTLKHLTQYSFAEFRYINTLRRQMLEYYIDLVLALPEPQMLALAQTKSLSLFVENLYRLITQKSPTSEYGKELLEGEQAPEAIVFNEKVKAAQFNEQLLIPVRQREYRDIVMPVNKRDHEFFNKLLSMSMKVVPLLEKTERVSLLVSDAFHQISKMQLTETELRLKLIEF